MKIIVMGAGVVGTASAWYLARAGHDVTVFDRESAAGMQTSYANGGQISVSHAEPWANPGAPFKVLQWLGREDAPLLFRLRADPRQWVWGLRFMFECLPRRARANTEQAFSLALYSRGELQALRRETGIAYDQQTRGILHFYTDGAEFAHGRARAELLARRGFDIAVKTPQECAGIEPALAQGASRIVGGVYCASDESGDAHKFTQALAGLTAARGVRFYYGAQIKRFLTGAGGLAGVAVSIGAREEVFKADAYVLALGSYSTLLAAGLGLSIPVYPLKGYSITLPLAPDAIAPQVSLSDDEHKIVFSRLGERLRAAGTAELTGYDTSINRVRCEAILRRALELFPQAGDPAKAEFWAGLRPATPNNLPLIGRTRYANLFLNTGHGTLGWTMACGSGRALADLISGRRPEVDFRFLGLPLKAA
jgi:D-amino-acid dehydrogenase